MFAYFVVRTLTSGKDVRVRTPMGLVDGTQQWVLERNVFYYLGLPYASKPARFQRAMPLVDQFQPNYIVPKRPNVRYHPIPARLVEQDLGCGPASSECLEAADASLLENLASRRLQGPPDTLTVTEARPGNQHVLLLGYVAGQGTALLGDLLHDIANGTGTEPPAELWLQALQDQLNFD
ncbi:hypothetical protein V5799_005825, partial [Amblyomma americanum]